MSGKGNLRNLRNLGNLGRIMRTNFAIDDNNGFLIVEDQAVLLEGKEAIAVNCTTEAQTLLGENPYFQENGMPNFETVWQGSPNIPAFESALRDILVSIIGVFNANNFSYTLENNILDYSIDIQTLVGTTTITGSLNA